MFTSGTSWYCVQKWDKVVLCTPVGQGGTVYTSGTRWYCVHQWDKVVLCTPVGQGGTVHCSRARWYCVPVGQVPVVMYTYF